MASNAVGNSSSSQGTKSVVYHLATLITAVAWGVSFISTKVLLNNGLNAVEIYLYRFIIAYLCVLAFCPKPFFSHSWADELKFMLCGICGGSLYFITENIAVNYTLVTNVSLIVTLAPLLTAFLFGLVYRTERPSRGFMIGSFIAFFGVACVVFNSSFVVKLNPLGDFLALLSAICFSIYSVVLRPLNAVYGTWFITRKTFFYGLITGLPFLLIEPNLVSWRILIRPEILLNIAFLGLFCSLLAYVLWAQGVKHLGAVKAGNYLYICPIVTLLVSSWVLGEKISTVGVIGCALILGGVILSEKLSRPRDNSASPRA